jgi:hypothetical protein
VNLARHTLDWDGAVERRAGAVAILRSGALAERACRRGGRAEVAAVFDRSFYLRAGAMFLCVGTPAIGNGPLTLVADVGDGADAARFSELGLRPGQPAELSARSIVIDGAITFGLSEREPWRPPAWPSVPPDGGLVAACAALARRAAAEAPAEGFARVVFGGAEQDATSLARMARPRIADFASSLSPVVRGDRDDLDRDAVRRLIGLGPGLTPSGDDFLCGALAFLDACGITQAHAALARAVIEAAALTSPLSACFLRAAADRNIGEYLHRAVASLIAGDIDAAIAAARRIGHSSGWDMLAGAATTLRMVVHELPGH